MHPAFSFVENKNEQLYIFVMAQILKDDVRNRIVTAAITEFLEKGYENASLRKIASDADMTVGNLYRYYSSKEDLLRNIVAPAYDALSDLVNKVSGGNLGLDMKMSTISIDRKSLRSMLDSLADGLVDIFDGYPKELGIMMIDSSLNKQLVDWFSDLIRMFIDSRYHVPGFKKEKAVISKSFAVSIFSGVREMFISEASDSGMLRSLVRIYFRSYISLLDNDIRKYIGG